MHQLTRELAEAAGFFPVPDNTEHDFEYRAENARYERFAKLIVEECIREMTRIATEAEKNFTYMGEEVPTFVLQCAIRNRFGT